MTSRSIPGLDGFRAIAIGCVVLDHAIQSAEGRGELPGWLSGAARFLPSGYFGVQIFFVISGFLITHLLLRERERSGRVSLSGFYRRRAYRILPAFYAFLAVVVVLWVAGVIELGWPLVVTSALFLRDYMPSGGSWYLGHTWSLAIEEQFYLLWPLLLVRVSRRWCLRLLVLGVALSPLVRLATWELVPAARSGIGVMFHTRAEAIMLGCILALLWRDPRFGWAFDRALRVGLGWVALAWMPVTWFAYQTWGDGWRFTVGFPGDAFFAAVLIMWAIRRPESACTRALGWGPVAAVGVISYSLYLWQQVFISPLGTGWFGAFPVNVVLAFAAAGLSYRFVEQPFLRLRERRRVTGMALAEPGI